MGSFDLLAKRFKKNLKQIRESKGVSQQDLASSLSKDRQSIHRLEKDGTNPTLKLMCELADALEVDLKEFFKEIE